MLQLSTLQVSMTPPISIAAEPNPNIRLGVLCSWIIFRSGAFGRKCVASLKTNLYTIPPPAQRGQDSQEEWNFVIIQIVAKVGNKSQL
jgi:hypothetical protein